MTFAPVIPTSYQADRETLYAGIEAIVEAFIASESYQCGRTYRSALSTLTGEVPMVVMGDVTEAILHDAQTRRTTFRGDLWYLDWLTAPEEYVARVNRWADRMRDLMTYNAMTLGYGELVQTAFTPGELRQEKVVVGAPYLTYEWRVQGGYR